MVTKKFLDFCKEHLEEREIRFCSCCGKAFTSGFYAGGDYYCSEKCRPYSDEEWDELYEDGNNDDYYWTEWEGDPELVKTYNELLKIAK